MTPSIPPELPADNPQTRWYYSDENSQVVGPLSFVELEKFAAAGIVAPTTYVFEEGVTEWLPFSESRAARRLREPASLPAPPETSPHAISSKSQPRWLNKATEITTVIVTEIIREGYSLCRSFLGGASESEVAATPPAPHPIFEKLIKHWRTLALLYFLYPIGLFMLIRNKALSRRAKLGAGIGFGVVFLIAVATVSPRSNTRSYQNFREAANDPNTSRPPHLRISQHLQVIPGTWLFADEGAFDDYQKAQATKNTEALALLKKDKRAIEFRAPGGEVWLSGIGGFQGYVQVRLFLDGLRTKLWVSPKSLDEWPTPRKFAIGNTVEIAEDATVYPNPDAIRAYKDAEAADNEEKTKALWEQVRAQRNRMKHRARAVVLAIGEGDYYETEGKSSDGVPIRHWVYGGWLFPYSTPDERPSAASPSQKQLPSAGFVVADGTTVYIDEQTYRAYHSNKETGEHDTTEIYNRLTKEKRMWRVQGSFVVNILRDGPAAEPIMVEAKDASRVQRPRFWLERHELNSLASFKAQRMIQPDRTRHILDFIHVFEGDEMISINEADVGNLAELIEAIYDGKVSPQLASRYAFRPDATEGVFTKVVGNFLIYKVAIPNFPYNGRELEFAMQRDPVFEREKIKHYGTLEAFYEDLEGDSGSPLTENSVVVVGMEQFTTGGGLLKAVPLVKTVSLVP